jgi:hypothetical protein
MTRAGHEDSSILSGFENNCAHIHALEFAKARIQDYYEYHIQTVGKDRRGLETERDCEIEKISEKIDILKKRRSKILNDSNEDSLGLASMIRSGCEIYLKDLQVLKKRTRMIEFEEEIGRVAEILENGLVSGAEGGLYNKYYSGEYCDYCRALIPVRGKACNKCVRVLGSRISNPMKL